MNNMNNKLIVSLIIIPVFLGMFKGPEVMAISVVAIALAFCFSNIDKFVRFKGAGFEAELKTAVNDAYAAIEQLKELGLSLSGPIVDELAVSGTLIQYIHLKDKLERVAEIANILKKLGATQKEIEDVCSSLYDRVMNNHTRRIFQSLKIANPEKNDLFEGVIDGLNEARIQKLIQENELKKNDDTNECLLDLDYFIKNKKLRRENEWQS